MRNAPLSLCLVLTASLPATATRAADTIIVDFEEAVPSSVSEYVESGVTFRSYTGTQLMGFTGHPRGTLGMFEATADEGAHLVTATWDEPVDEVTVEFAFTRNKTIVLRAFDEDGWMVDGVELEGHPTDPFALVRVPVRGKGIRMIQFGGDELLVAETIWIGGTPLVGDANVDGAVDVQDLLAVLAAWDSPCTHCLEDIDGSGTVDVNDVTAVLAHWSVP